MQHVKFEDVFTKVCGFYREKDGTYQPKKATIIVRAVSSLKDDKICDVTINLASYIGRGTVNDSQNLSGAAFFIDFEISVEPTARESHDDDDDEENEVLEKSASQPLSTKNSGQGMSADQR